MQLNRLFSHVFTYVLLVVLAGCSTLDKIMPQEKADYRKSTTLPQLEVPPGMSSPTLAGGQALPVSTTSYSEYIQDKESKVSTSSQVLPAVDGIVVRGEGDKRWLLVNIQLDDLWDKVRSFWLQSGFELVMENPALGIMETDWAENRADIADGPVRRLFGSVMDGMYSAATRDSFRVRLDFNRDNNQTEIFIVHRGMEEVVEGPADETTGTKWRQRDNDPELEIEMLRRLMVYLGAGEKQAQSSLAQKQESTIHAQLIHKEGQLSLVVADTFARTWRRTGIALDRIGFAVEDRDRSKGSYFVRYMDPFKDTNKGFLDKWLPWRDEKEGKQHYQIRLLTGTNNTHIEILNKQGQVDYSGTAVRILKLLEEQLR
ncbi:MAG: outer membrane protein assembly factor BamC [Gammaproteobacteria bacterium]|nr:outer membrane protein assembly factor BamC [Gammaproteobacteria bacterium]